MKILKHGIMDQSWPTYELACASCHAEVQLEKGDSWRGWWGSKDDGNSVAMWRCPECHQVNRFSMEWDRLKLLPDREAQAQSA